MTNFWKLIASLLWVASTVAQSQSIAWEELATRSVDRTLDRDVIQLSSKKVYTALKITLEKGTINVYKATLHFDDGASQNIKLPEVLSKENDNYSVDLTTNRKVIDKITFWYDTTNSVEEKAVVKIWARK